MTRTTGVQGGKPPTGAGRTPRKPLTPEAERALAEAEARRKRRPAEPSPGPAEEGGREGPDPVRYGDWEKDGIVSDF